MILSHSAWRRVLVSAVAAGGIVVAYQATMLDSEYAARQAARADQPADPTPGARLGFTATAYCKGDLTASGVAPRAGIAAADPTILPVGSVVQVGSGEDRYSGIYTVMDTGPLVQGRRIDLYMWSCNEALAFGRRPVQVTVLRLGWHPKTTLPKLLEALVPWRERAAPPPARLPSRPTAPPDAGPPPASPKPPR